MKSLENTCLSSSLETKQKKTKKGFSRGGLWHFNQALIVLKESEGIGEISSQLFTHATFWVQIKDVPIMCMDEEIYTTIGELIGKVEEIDTNKIGDCLGQVIRLRISIDITQPLMKILFIESEDGKKVPVSVEYEKLPDWGHSYKECEKYEGQSKQDLAYRPWLKALSWVEKTKQNRSKERRTTDVNKRDERKTQNEGESLEKPLQQTQLLVRELKESEQRPVGSDQREPDQETHHRVGHKPMENEH